MMFVFVRNAKVPTGTLRRRSSMKWFKHMSDASSDEFIVELEETFGLPGVARWWKLIEAVAANVDPKKGVWAVRYPWSKWQTLLRGKKNKLRTFLEHLENKRRISTEQTDNFLRIEIPKLKQLCDNYTKDLQVTTRPTSKQEVEEEGKKKKEDKKNKRVSKFVKPSVKEVREYCIERKNRVDAESFMNHYDSNGWKVGKNSMKDWKACVRTWEKNSTGGVNQSKEEAYQSLFVGAK